MKSYKLNESKVALLKRRLLDGKMNLKQIGDEFGVSDMQVSRINRGIHWPNVKASKRG